MLESKKRALFEKLVREHHAQLRGFIRLLGVHPDSVDDIAQDVFLTAYSKLDRFDGVGEMEKWLRGVARNRVLNEFTKQSRRMRIQSESLYSHLKAMSEEEHGSGPFQDEHHQALSHCLSALPEKSRGIIEAYYQNELNSVQIGEHYKTSSGAIRLTLHRIRQKLKNCIETRMSHV